MIEDLKSLKEQWDNTRAEYRAIIITTLIIVGIITVFIVAIKWPLAILLAVFFTLVGFFCFSLYMVVLLSIK